MARGALTTVLSVGLSAGVVVLSFFGCFTPLDEETGKCQAADAGASDAGPGDCTIPKCNADGTPAPEPVPNAEKKVCFRGENEGVCVDGDCALICETQMVPCKCATDTACPDDKQCIDWACVAGACISTAIKEGELLDPLETGDCKKSVCQGGKPTSVNDDADVAADMPGDCQVPTCENMVPNFDPAPSDIPADVLNDCKTFKCTGDVSGFDVNPNDAPVAMECVEFVCNSGGSSDPMNAAKGKKCSIGECDGNGECKLKIGDVCANGTECASGNCADGVCCNTGCANECKSCNQAGKIGTCTNTPLFGDDDYDFNGSSVKCEKASGFECNGMGACKLRGGVNCNNDATTCVSNECTMTCKWLLNEPCSKPTDCAASMLACKNGTCQTP